MKILYRISEGGNTKLKPDYVYDKQRMFLHFIKTFAKHDIYVFADNVGTNLYLFLLENYDTEKIFRTSHGNSNSFFCVLDFAIKNFNDDDILYFAEDDYIYKPNAPEIIEEGLRISDYSSGYDHPDKYVNYSEGGDNPFIENGGELTRVVTTQSTHWKYTNSFCMTFASTVQTMKEDYHVFKSHNAHDFPIFRELIESKNRKLASCIPSVSTHGETHYMAKFVDWEKLVD